MLLVASETGHVYTFATPKLQPMITSETGKALIQTCLHQPDPPNAGVVASDYDMRMSANGYEETELGYQVPEEDFKVRREKKTQSPNAEIHTVQESFASTHKKSSTT